jgi:tetratricopeptide (TPR) repeat protein
MLAILMILLSIYLVFSITHVRWLIGYANQYPCSNLNTYELKSDHVFNIDDYVISGSHLADQREFPQAIISYNKFLKLSPYEPAVYYLRGYSYEQQANYVQAYLDYTNALWFFMLNGKLYMCARD